MQVPLFGRAPVVFLFRMFLVLVLGKVFQEGRVGVSLCGLKETGSWGMPPPRVCKQNYWTICCWCEHLELLEVSLRGLKKARGFGGSQPRHLQTQQLDNTLRG